MPNSDSEIIAFFFSTSLLILILTSFIVTIIYLYYRKHVSYKKELEEVKSSHEKELLNTELEIQEQTFQNISREIHDNIALALTLAKLNLNKISKVQEQQEKIESAIGLISTAIKDLSDLSKSLNSDLIQANGFIRALEIELAAIKTLDTIRIDCVIVGETYYLDKQKEIILFRIVQEILNNMLKHSGASLAQIRITYELTQMHIQVTDDGVGFDLSKESIHSGRSGLHNIKQRVRSLGGLCKIHSELNAGTNLSITIPYLQYESTLN